MRPGIYEITGSKKEKCNLTVEIPKELENYKQYLSQSTSINLSENGFDKKEIKVAPGEGIAIILEIDSNIDLSLIKPIDVIVKDSTTKSHRWQKPPSSKSGKKK
jgi:hypothetical protein